MRVKLATPLAVLNFMELVGVEWRRDSPPKWLSHLFPEILNDSKTPIKMGTFVYADLLASTQVLFQNGYQCGYPERLMAGEKLLNEAQC